MPVPDWVEFPIAACLGSAPESTCWADDLEWDEADNW
jgi:hypothetical protein